MSENIIVGAGFAGLVAAINLARSGRDVVVLEKESRIGGSPLFHPSPEGTPIDIKALEAYIGIDLSPEAAGPGIARFQSGNAVAWGTMLPADMDAISSWVIERGPRSTSLDTYLYKIAVAEGVKFEFNQPIWSNDDIAKLPPDTIIATGLNFDGFDSVHQPYRTSFHFVARQTIPDATTNHVTIYHGDFTTDYAYTSSINGIQFAHVFQRNPIGHDTLKAFEEQCFISEGIEFKSWEHFTFPVPARSIHTPRLFAGDKILAGTLAGCMESFMFFGMLGGLVSGKIAALAVEDKAVAMDEFKLATSSFAPAYMLKKMTNLMPHELFKRNLRFALAHAFDIPLATKIIREAMPGWKNCAKGLPTGV
jgi:NAD(P)-binding Rossmann-like domain